MKYIILIFVLVLFSCNDKSIIYSGYVYYKDEPIFDVKIKRIYAKENNFVTTDTAGFFQIFENYHNLKPLVFQKEGFINDTVPIVWHNHGERENYNFTKKNKDTVFLKLKE